MAEPSGGDSGGGGGGGSSSSSNRDASRPRQRVQQLRPTNKDTVVSAPVAAPSSTTPTAATATAPAGARSTTTSSTDGGGATAQPAAPAKVVPRIVTGQGSGSTILVNNCQRGNPILQHIRNIGWEYGDIVPDYQVGVASCALFLSLRYHRLHPEYIHSRIQKMGHMYTLRILLVMCDVDQHQSAIKELTKVCLINNLTLMVAWTPEEAGSYIERYKAFEHKAPDLIKERVDDDYMSRLNSALTNIKGVNKTDVITLATNFGSLKRIADASGEDLSHCPGFGATKVKRIRDVFTQPFRVGETRLGRARRAERERLYGSGSSNSKEAASATGNGDASPSAPKAAAKGRFIDDEEEEQAILEIEAQRLSQKAAATSITNGSQPKIIIVADPTSYVSPKGSGGGNTQAVNVDVEEEVEDADDWDIMDQMTEEERLQLAIEMSRTEELDEDE